MYNLLIDIVTNNIPENFIGFINRSLDEKIRKELKKLQLVYSNIDLDTIKDHFFIYITNIENPGYTLENYENVINKAIDSINFKYKYDSESLSFRESILYIKIFNEKENKTIEFKGLKEDKDDNLVNSSTFNNFSSELRKNQIILKKEERLQSFEKSANKLARANGCSIINNKSILNEYANKFDYPVSVEGSFDEKYLCIDKSILYTVLMENFTVLPMEFDNGNSSNFFVYAKNKSSEDSHILIKEINDKLEEINNLINQKSDRKLEDFVEDLKTVNYINNYGNFYDKTQRLIKISVELCKMLTVSNETIDSVKRIAFLCKADKATEIVQKCPYLHGLIGKLYAKSDGEDTIVYDGVYEHIKPRFLSENIPNSTAARIVAISDKMEYVMSYIISSSDDNFKYNYKLRKTITSVISIILRSELDFNLSDFITKILYVFLQDKGIVDYEYFEKSIKEIILDVYRDECIKLGYDFDEVDVINYNNLNIFKLNRLLTNLHDINTKNNGKLMIQILKMLEINSSECKYTPMELDNNNLCNLLEKLANCSDEDLPYYKLIFKGVFKKIN
ncbi:glycine--tRNA ligase subunit beta [Finegoldia sp. BIOML-A2]|uniref:glycine--tRNA ligase subunit beta n=2 Tax=Peptoniphilaceae TaxID=1570339 RepID=UPI0012B04FBF|nr:MULTISPECIES: glycine--tRNA ligase subunit beta [Finegoldia]MCC2716491.1 glycine--tRNA ligase subunit beta [Finegoldia magna]MDU4209830.1 glycine--tRNA ligase subunit beta [Finegoldia magna]MSA97123.1 glycine--tRNA ligase subunit beta [Finegoldia sp. BIOML-A5]MSA98248.1 glycine--tRNA ligase subunit beta [Finegoldia sp. BIOML-A3]MSB00395.1 glycine--tRNA ligase subunit beta [Finegoldia sp. BIOML-A2]